MAPGDADWSRYMRFLENHMLRSRERRALVLERGFGPTIRHRQQLHTVTAGETVRAAILTDSAFARGITAMVAMVNPGYRAFPTDGIEDALAHLGIEPARAPEFRAA